MIGKRVEEQIIKESMIGNRRLSDKDLKAFNRYQKLLQILNSTDKEPLKRFLHSFRKINDEKICTNLIPVTCCWVQY